MKRIIALLMIVLLLIPAVLSAQDNLKQERNILGKLDKDIWYYYTTDQDENISNIWFNNIKAAAAGAMYSQKYYTAVYETWPSMAWTVTAADTNTAADSIDVLVVLQQSATSDTTGFASIDTLNFFTTAIGAAKDSLTSAATWISVGGDTTHSILPYHRLVIIPGADHRQINDGVKLKIIGVGKE